MQWNQEGKGDEECCQERGWGARSNETVTSVQLRQMWGLALEPYFNTHFVWAQAQGQDLQET